MGTGLAQRVTGQARNTAQLAGAAWPQFVRPLVLELASHRPIRELLPGVHHWTAIHPRIRLPVDSYYIEPAGIVLDPMVPREGLGVVRAARDPEPDRPHQPPPPSAQRALCGGVRLPDSL